MAVSGVSDLAGRVLAGRYRLLTPIGAGASGRVYMADDIRLTRRVAVKVLHAALAEDAGFLRRFRAEAQVAASLHHPNVMAVYDWGEDEVPFMVLELLEGGSLRGMLDQGHFLTPAQSAHVGRQVANALDYAHTRGLVHRDIKPANLLFDEHGIVRVADFGLARALAEASWTEPAGAVLGTARYAAPEQGTGRPLDGRADLYSLAVVLVEAVTGKVPHQAETTVAMLTSRASSPIVAPPQLGPLGAVVERAGQPNPDDRYPDAATMSRALADAGRALPPPGPLVLVGPGEVVEDHHPTAIHRPAGTPGIYDQDAGDTTTALTTADNMRVVPPPSKAARTARAWVPSAVLGTVLAIVIGAIAIVLTQPSGASVSIPQLVGLTQAQAVSTAAKPSDLRVSVKRSQFSDELKGTVLSQSPTAGAWSQGGDSISVVVSNGPKPIVITNVQGLSPETATAALEKQGFVVKTGDPIYSAKAADKGSVQKTDPAIGSGITPGSTVTIYASKGLAPVKVPNITGATTYADAAQMVTAAGFVPQQLPTNSDTVPSGGLIPITNPVAGTELTPGSPVQIQVSIGPALIPIPSYVGQTVTQATAALTALQMKVQVVNFTGNPNSKVKAQTPVNVSVPHQTSIQLIL